MVKHIVLVAEIDDTGRKRPVDPDLVELIMASVNEIGLQQAIVVRPHPDKNSAIPYKLVIGGHRYASFQRLGWTELVIDEHVKVVEMTDDEADLAEIDENLARHELNALDRALFLLERQRVYEAAHPETAHGKASKPRSEAKRQTLPLLAPHRFSKEVAKKIGLSERAIRLSLTLARALDKEAVEELRGTPLATNQRELLELAKLDREQQRDVAKSIQRGYAKTTVQARIHLGLTNQPAVSDPQARLYAALLDAWTKADKTTRAQFLAAADLIYAPAAPAKPVKK